ncbi:MAG TPA: hypothetical protein VK563_16675 [Puia sp.]|nr:hypothetical protein [Puia sp.]
MPIAFNNSSNQFTKTVRVTGSLLKRVSSFYERPGNRSSISKHTRYTRYLFATKLGMMNVEGANEKIIHQPNRGN